MDSNTFEVVIRNPEVSQFLSVCTKISQIQYCIIIPVVIQMNQTTLKQHSHLRLLILKHYDCSLGLL